MKLLVIGHSVLDKINRDNKVETKPGGIFYSAVTLANLMNKNDEIYLMTEFDNINIKYFRKVYEKFNLTLSKKVDEIPVVNLFIHPEKERDEIYSKIPGQMEFNWNFDYSIFDGVLLNMVSGVDIRLSDLQKLRSKIKCPVYFDVHTFSREADSKQNRKFRTIPGADNWLVNTDIVQANESELRTLYNSKCENEIARFVLNMGVSALIVTKGDRGVRLYRKQKNDLTSFFLPAVKVNSVNAVGCGDTFGASFFYHYIRTYDFNKSLRYANIAAGIVTGYKKIENYNRLKYDIDQGLN